MFQTNTLLIEFSLQTPSGCLEEDKESIIQKLKERAVKEACCGQTAVVERKAALVPKSEAIVHAIVTNIIEYGVSLGEYEASPLKRRNEGLLDSGMSWKRTKARKRSSRHRR